MGFMSHDGMLDSTISEITYSMISMCGRYHRVDPVNGMNRAWFDQRSHGKEAISFILCPRKVIFRFLCEIEMSGAGLWKNKDGIDRKFKFKVINVLVCMASRR